ncbi:T9SS type A sorting domain-containing protein [Bizionia arctica]|uniref:Secretion system C-terminal sorting domain-containing protein n=1 Tax=Bizionia arctica TaxID=1495645 RepID=A0A917GWC7_9FLAO|nr:T9SS type A sorting domain-containing protein [Bizionia arctica]GGG59263.1 hypothetical protein GCM10010976_32520 [Bizionia arctica]
MKKNYILFLFFGIFFLQINAQTDCSQSNAPTLTTVINTNPEGVNQSVALDLLVEAGTQFNLESVTVLFLSNNGAALNSTGTVSVYNASGTPGPGTIITTETMAPTAVTQTGVISTYTMFNVTFTFTSPVVLDNTAGTSGATFWVGFNMGNVAGSETGIGGGTSSVVGNAYAFKNNNTSGIWAVTTSGVDGIYTFNGTCSLGVDEYALSNVSIYPNPMSNEVNINLHNSLQVNRVTIYSITGQEVLKVENKSKLDVSKLNPGIYVLKIETDEGSITKKMVKN